MFISYAYATEAAAAAVDADPWSAVFSQFILIVALVGLFYLLLILPQQRRFKEHKAMLDALKKGDKVVTSGGLIGSIDALVNDQEVIVDLGNGVKVTALRSTISQKVEKDAKNDNAKK